MSVYNSSELPKNNSVAKIKMAPKNIDSIVDIYFSVQFLINFFLFQLKNSRIYDSTVSTIYGWLISWRHEILPAIFNVWMTLTMLHYWKIMEERFQLQVYFNNNYATEMPGEGRLYF